MRLDHKRIVPGALQAMSGLEQYVSHSGLARRARCVSSTPLRRSIYEASVLRYSTAVPATACGGPPVYLIYLTAFAQDGEATFRDDIYDRDDAILRALAVPRLR